MLKLIFLTLLIWPCFSSAASFACSKAASLAEMTICNDQDLSKSDDELGGIYERARFKTPDQKAFRQQAIAAWKWREANCHTKECLIKWYAERSAILLKIANAPPAENMPPSLPKLSKGMTTSGKGSANRLESLKPDVPAYAAADSATALVSSLCRTEHDCQYMHQLYRTNKEFQNSLDTVIKQAKVDSSWLVRGVQSPITIIEFKKTKYYFMVSGKPHSVQNAFYVGYNLMTGKVFGIYDPVDQSNGDKVTFGNPTASELILTKIFANDDSSIRRVTWDKTLLKPVVVRLTSNTDKTPTYENSKSGAKIDSDRPRLTSSLASKAANDAAKSEVKGLQLRDIAFLCIDPNDIERYLGLITRGLGGAGLDGAIRFQTQKNNEFKCYTTGYFETPVDYAKTLPSADIVEVSINRQYRQRDFPPKMFTTKSNVLYPKQ